MVLSDELQWVKASSSVGQQACVELAASDEMIALRNSREPDVVLNYTKAEIAAFIDAARSGEFDYLVQ